MSSSVVTKDEAESTVVDFLVNSRTVIRQTVEAFQKYGHDYFKQAFAEAVEHCRAPGATLSASDVVGKELLEALHQVLPNLERPKSEPEPEAAPEPKSSRSSADISKRLREGFQDPYHGRGVDGLYEHLTEADRRWPEDSYYGKFISVAQSSGAGKTRTIFELATKGVIVLYLNLRPNLYSTNFSEYPPRTEFIADWLTSFASMDSQRYRCRCYYLFTALFTQLKEELKQLREESKTDTVNEVTKAWAIVIGNAGQGARYKAFVARVAAQCGKFEPPEDHNIQVRTTASAPSPKRQSSKGDTRDAAQDTTEATAALSLDDQPERGKKRPKYVIARGLMLEAYKDLRASYPELFSSDSHEPKLVIAFDEAHPLAPSVPATEPFRPSHVLCQVISHFSVAAYQSVWVIFASTNSRITDFSAPAKLHDSARVNQGGKRLFAPYTLMGWDQFAPQLKTLLDEPAQISTGKALAKFGRPLWGSLQGVSMQIIIDLAKQKIVGTTGGVPIVNTANAALAVISQRLAVTVCFGHPDAVGIVDDAIAGHLRVCLGTTEDRVWRFTTYSSEPLLSHAAAELIEKWPNVFEHLKMMSSSGMIERGRNGELACRLLLLYAKDAAIRAKIPRTKTELESEDMLYYCQPIGVLDYLQAMFGNKIWPTDAGERRAVQEDFKYAKVNFSHWTPMSGHISSKGEEDWDWRRWLFRHYSRTSGVQCCHNQPDIDQVIPVYFDCDDKNIPTLSKMSLIMVQDKATEKASVNLLKLISRYAPSINCGDPKKQRQKTAPEWPSIAILLDTGIKKPSAEFTSSYPVSTDYNTRNLSRDRCWRIYVPGLDPFDFLRSKGNEQNQPKDEQAETKSNEQPFVSLVSALHELIHPTYVPPVEYPVAKGLLARTMFGEYARDSYMAWDEHGN